MKDSEVLIAGSPGVRKSALGNWAMALFWRRSTRRTRQRRSACTGGMSSPGEPSTRSSRCSGCRSWLNLHPVRLYAVACRFAGPHPSQASLPSHGYARITPWELTSVQTLSNGATKLNLTLGKSDLSQLHWQAEVRLELKITAGDTLELSLTTVNESDHEITFTEGLHTYFQISDISNIRVLGLERSDYIDLVNQNEQRTQQDAITFDGELGRFS